MIAGEVVSVTQPVGLGGLLRADRFVLGPESADGACQCAQHGLRPGDELPRR